MGVMPGKATNDPNAYLAFGLQPAKGTEANTFRFVKQLDGSGLDVQREIQRVKEGGDGQEDGLAYVSRVNADGAVNGNARPIYAGMIAAGVLGQDAVVQGGTNGISPSLSRHTLTYAASLPYWTVEQRWSDEVERAVDVVMTTMTIQGEAGQPWQINANYIGGGTVYERPLASALTPTREVGKPFMYPAGSYIFDGAASYAHDFTRISVEVSRNVDDGIQTTGLTRDDVIPLAFDVAFEGTLKYTSRDFYNKVKYNGGSVVLSDLATGSVELAQLQQVYLNASVSATGLMRAVLPCITWDDAQVNKLSPDGQTVYMDVTGHSIKSGTSSFIFEIDLPFEENLVTGL